MKDLAIVVAIIFLVSITAGPFALLVTFIKPRKYFSLANKRFLVAIASVFASMSGALLISGHVAPIGKLIGVTSLSLASFSSYRVFQPQPDYVDPDADSKRA